MNEKLRKFDITTPPVLSHPSVKERESLTQHIHVWKVGDRYYKLGSSILWRFKVLVGDRTLEFKTNRGTS